MIGSISVGTSAPTGTTATTTTQSGSTAGYGALTLTQGTGKQVTAAFNTKGSCDPYALDWGDDSTNNTRLGGASPCSTSENLSLSHTYDAAGTYTVTLARGPALLDETTKVVTVQ
jgi:PKD repeat protein